MITISADIHYIYNFVPENYRESFGSMLTHYFEALIRAIDGLTDDGKDTEAQGELRKAFFSGLVVLQPHDKVAYCAVDFDAEGALCVLFHPEKWPFNIDSNVGYSGNLLIKLDEGLSCRIFSWITLAKGSHLQI